MQGTKINYWIIYMYEARSLQLGSEKMAVDWTCNAQNFHPKGSNKVDTNWKEIERKTKRPAEDQLRRKLSRTTGHMDRFRDGHKTDQREGKNCK